ncbi:MAG: glycosyltransferase [Clostridia bacterium]|nr:glycosyltransferase [Clostridia bacterium]
MKVSVIIPCYNVERYLAQCLDSVLAQDMPDFEVLLIDDGSTDGTPAIAARYAQRDARVTVLSQGNSGVSAARNLGLDHARGEWITFVDGDDLLERDALSRMLSVADGETDLVVCAHRTFDEAGGQEVFWPQTRWMDKRNGARRRAAALRLIEGDSVLNIMCNKLHRRALIEREHLRLDSGVAIAEDALFNLEAVLCGRAAAYVHRVTYRYRTHAQSAMHTRMSGGAFDVHLPWLRAMRDMLLRRGEMECFYAAYVDSVVLRLYKDGGVAGVVRGFNAQARPLVVMDALDRRRMTPYARAVLALSRSGLYPFVYPLIFPVQLARRKAQEAAFLLRAEREKPE